MESNRQIKHIEQIEEIGKYDTSHKTTSRTSKKT